MRISLILALLALLASPFVWACDSGTVRDAAFAAERDVHRLVLFTDGQDPAAGQIFSQLAGWFQTDAAEFNAQLVQVDAQDASVDWEDFGIPSAPPSLPVVALIGLFPSPRRAFVIDHWEPAPTSSDLGALLTSPVREAVKEAVLDHWAVVLHSPGAGGQDSARQAVANVARRWAVEQPPGIAVIEFDRTDPQERLLSAFAGIEPSGPGWVGVVFGRGKLMAPPLEGDAITEDNLNGLLESLTTLCTCLQESTTRGLDVPMAWNERLDAQVASLETDEQIATVGIEQQFALMEAEAVEVQPRLLTVVLAPLGVVAGIAMLAVALVILRARRNAAPAPE